MKYINQTYQKERSLYHILDSEVVNCTFEGQEDGESPLKECKNVTVINSKFNLRYPFWHNNSLTLNHCKMLENCRAPLWYCNDVAINHCEGTCIKALRESSNISISNSTFESSEFGWNCKTISLVNSKFVGFYFLMGSSDVTMSNCHLNGKYSFQYMKNVVIKDSKLETKDAFWHCNNVVIENSTIEGEYIGWYSKNLTFKNCKIKGTQPFCYCKKLKLIDCELIDADFAFENSDVKATLKGKVISIKNPHKGYIKVPQVDQIIKEDSIRKVKAKIIITK